MNRRILTFCSGLFLITCSLIIIDSIIDITPRAEAATFYVGGVGPGNYTHIYEAVFDANSGDEIYVYPGIYNESISIHKSINLTGENKSNTIIDGHGWGYALYISWNWVNVTGFTFTNASNGINIRGSHVTISDNIIEDNSGGGIYMEGSFITIENNYISNNSNLGIWFDYSSDITLINNDLINNGILMEGDELSHFNFHKIGTDNTINGKPIYYFNDTSDILLDNVPVGQVIIANCTDINLWNLTIQGIPNSILIVYSSNISITGNNISDNECGIYSYFCWSLGIFDNNISHNNDYGIRLQKTSDINITSNVVSSNKGEGIYLLGSSNSSIRYNEISHNEDSGILLAGSEDNIISHNNVTDNGFDSNPLLDGEGGIFLSSSSFNIVTNNNITLNYDFGICLTRPFTWPPVEPPKNNTITNNYISSNNGFLSFWGAGISCKESINVTISGNTVLNQSNGIGLRYVSRSNINNNIVFDNSESGISMSLSDNISMSNNTAFTCQSYGIYIDESQDLLFINNSAYDNYGGFCTDYSSILTLLNNTMINNSYNFYILGEADEHYIHSIDTSNTVDGKPIYYLVNVSDYIVPENAGFVGGIFCNNITTENNILRNNSHGVLFWKTNNSQINNVTSYFNYDGLYFYHSVNNSIINSSFYKCAWYGLGFFDSHYNSIENSHFYNCGYDGINLDISANNTIFGGNVSVNKDEGIEFRYSSFNDIIDVNVSSNQWRGIYIYGSSYLNIIHNDLWDEWNAIEGWGTYNNISYNNIHDNSFDGIEISGTNHTITHNYFSRNMLGITIQYSGNSRIINNDFLNNTDGIFLYESYDHYITNNNFSGNIHGIDFHHSTTNQVLNNTFFKNLLGIYLSSDSNYNIINGNEILSNSNSGIYIYWYCHNNTITNNNISWNFDYGIYLNRSKDNLIYHNNIIGNGNQSYDDSVDGNRWNESYPFGGNYWSDYVGTDDFKGPAQNITGSDGFGDTPYIIDGDSQDHYPLMKAIEMVEPKIYLISPLNNSIIRPGTSIYFWIYDENLDFVIAFVDGNPGQLLLPPYEISTDNWLDGMHNVSIVANDTYGNSASESFAFIIDSIKPRILLNEPANNSVIPGGVIINFSITDTDFKSAEYSIDGGGFTPFPEPYDISTTGWTEGEHIIQINAMDDVGNENSSWFVFFVDTRKPEIILNSPANNSLISGGTVLDFSIIEGNILVVNYSIDDGPDIILTYPFDIYTDGWVSGERIVQINVLDKAGNFTSELFIFYIDSSLPRIVLNNPDNNSVIASGTSIDFSITDNNLAQSYYSINGDPFTPFSTPYDVSTADWQDGEYTIQIKAVDTASNENISWFFFTIDSVVPVITLNSPSNGSIISAQTILDFSIQDPH
ncbi:MAG: right-handed parallel beta-helix repeat-containing protein, partial [Thermoplasmata archaeon]